MNTGSGLSFLRVVNEEGSNGWAQVYARIPFDNVELQSKGALFGVISGKVNESWADKDMELMEWIEEYFNKSENNGDLAIFFRQWRTKYPELIGAWLWVIEKNGRRELSMVRWGEAGISLVRKEKEFDFSKDMTEGKVVRGIVEEGDRMAVWTEGLPERLEGKKMNDLEEDEANQLNENISRAEFAGAGIVLNFQRYISDLIVEEKVEEVQAMTTPVYKTSEVELANEKYVGPLRLKEKIVNKWLEISSIFRKPIEQEGIVDRKNSSKRKRVAITLGLIFLGLLLVSLISGSIKMRKEAEMKEWKAFSEPIEKSLTEASGLVQLNISGARKLIQDSKAELESKKADFAKRGHVKDLAVLEKKISDTWTLVSGEKESQIEEIAKIDLVRQGFKGERMAVTKNKQLVVLDGAMGVTATVELKTKDIKVVAGKGEGLGWTDASGDGNRVMILNGSGIRKAADGQDLVKFDAAVIKPMAMGMFGGNLYILDQGNKEIFKYAAVGEGFGERTRWLKQDQNMSIVPVDMTIDSDVWAVSVEGQVERFRRGNKEQFSLSGLTPGLKLSRLAVEPEGDRIALLDNSAGAVAVCSKKTGACSQLLKSQRLREVSDIEFDDQGNLLVLLPGVVGVLK